MTLPINQTLDALQDDLLQDQPLAEEGESKVLSLPYGFAKRNGIVLDENEQGQAIAYYRAGMTAQAFAELQRFLQGDVVLQRVENNEFERLLATHYDRGGAEAQAMMEDIGGEMDLQDIAETLSEPQDLLESEDDAPIIRLINALLTQAVKENASDIHIETFESRMVVRMRVDGVLREIVEPPRSLAPLVISRIKVMAKLDIAEKRLPQDGRISLRVAGRPVDVRVSTLPSGHSERVVLRLLDKQAGRLQLGHLGMESSIYQRLDTIIRKPHGILLVTGPTGSGKTTTLYAALTDINDSSRNILTVEDPIEYFIDGIGQTQVNSKVDMSFARGLRAILRQDPDVVMVGEIRDLETVEIAIQASLTGHMVFSTLHTNTAIGAVTRLRDMGVEPFLLASSLIGVIAQRLVRLLCPKCKQPHRADESEAKLARFAADEDAVLYRAEGCPACNHTGYQGRDGIYELLEIDEELRQLVHDGAGEQHMERYARQYYPSIRDDGMRLVREGKTALEEVLRVTHEDSKG